MNINTVPAILPQEGGRSPLAASDSSTQPEVALRGKNEAIDATVSPIKWLGAKRRDRQSEIWQVLDHFWTAIDGPSRTLVEPFCGALNISLGLQAQSAICGDANPHLINFWQWVQWTGLQSQDYATDEQTYYTVRTEFNQAIARWQECGYPSKINWNEVQAHRFFYLLRVGFRGVCRFNEQGSFNVPFGHYKKPRYPIDLTPWQDAIANYVFTFGDWKHTLFMAKSYNVVIADPPYDDGFTTYTGQSFTWADQVHLAEQIATAPYPAVIHNKATPRILELYKSLGLTCEVVSAARAISADGDRTPCPEVVAYKMPSEAKRPFFDI